METKKRIRWKLSTEYASESAVRKYVRDAKARIGVSAPRAFIPLEPEAGIEAEVDWESAEAIISGKDKRLKFFCIRSKYSGKHFIRFYPCERQQAFFDAHIHAFNFFGGIFPVLRDIPGDTILNSNQKMHRMKPVIFMFTAAAPP